VHIGEIERVGLRSFIPYLQIVIRFHIEFIFAATHIANTGQDSVRRKLIMKRKKRNKDWVITDRVLGWTVVIIVLTLVGATILTSMLGI
jgi:hypothetical protein